MVEGLPVNCNREREYLFNCKALASSLANVAELYVPVMVGVDAANAKHAVARLNRAGLVFLSIGRDSVVSRMPVLRPNFETDDESLD